MFFVNAGGALAVIGAMLGTFFSFLKVEETKLYLIPIAILFLAAYFFILSFKRQKSIDESEKIKVIKLQAPKQGTAYKVKLTPAVLYDSYFIYYDKNGQRRKSGMEEMLDIIKFNFVGKRVSLLYKGIANTIIVANAEHSEIMNEPIILIRDDGQKTNFYENFNFMIHEI